MRTLVGFLALIAMSLPCWAADVETKYQVAPEDLVKQMQSAKAPLILNVGPQKLFEQAHIKGSEYIGAGSSAEGIAKLKERVKTLPKNAAIVLYCGCCPWDHCPNINPAFAALHEAGFTNVKVLFVAHNIGTDWVDKGYPVEKGK
ncbi:hypothetical protein Acid345_3928 [Candidatus Koribacter versatilis Ellin345]|uniref:Rhodanese domain-containing protein n=1 Tax=Koribacter versatilis (strain Ellin345) TaxID=204669 RepID=Q1IJM2_KORVE|nr:rhodanese-like domain-containing protein [Candidatus Koribacter versatilis]ABF42928.1 hypothetical protein Acid345_3928 [Candidatus Koribacter versatilis Ellin345]